jgi:hypothetical protein
MTDGGINVPARKGRNNMLLARRNECILARYYYYGYFKNKNYEEIMQLLMNEFYIAPFTISRLVQESMEQLQQIKQKSPSIGYFSLRWPHLKW